MTGVHRDHARHVKLEGILKPQVHQDPKPTIEPQHLIARCLVGGCGWSIPITRDALQTIEQHRDENHPWVKPGRLCRIELDTERSE